VFRVGGNLLRSEAMQCLDIQGQAAEDCLNLGHGYQACSQNSEKRLLASSSPSVRMEQRVSHWSSFDDMIFELEFY
jgi:hypothetical protein